VRALEGTFFDLGGDTSAALLAQWVRETVEEADQVVRMLDAASKADHRYGSAYLLVAESAVNVLRALKGQPEPG